MRAFTVESHIHSEAIDDSVEKLRSPKLQTATQRKIQTVVSYEETSVFLRELANRPGRPAGRTSGI